MARSLERGDPQLGRKVDTGAVGPPGVESAKRRRGSWLLAPNPSKQVQPQRWVSALARLPFRPQLFEPAAIALQSQAEAICQRRVRNALTSIGERSAHLVGSRYR